MKTIQTLYTLLDIKRKIPDQGLRFWYLKDAWGLNQDTISKIEGISQSRVSAVILKAKGNTTHDEFTKMADIQWTVDEIRYIQFLPREIIKDVEVIAFVNNILGLEVYHPFFLHFDHTKNMRMAALAGMGIMNKHLQTMFNKEQAAVSMNVKRYKERTDTLERPNRYDTTAKYALGLQKRKHNFILAGGQ